MVLLLALLACGSLTVVPPPEGPAADGPLPSAEEPADDVEPEAPLPGSDPTEEPASDTALAPVVCDPIADAGWEVCAETDDSCEARFTDGAGCATVCAAAGLACEEAYEDVPDTCAPDLGRPRLGCGWTGHVSDYCVCSGPLDPLEPMDEDCLSYPFRPETLLAEREGFGARAAGGDPSNVYFVTTLADEGPGSLREGLERPDSLWIAFDVEGTIVLESGRVHVESDKTVDGRGRDITVVGHLQLRDARNVIFTDLRLSNDLEGHCTQAGDVITVQGSGGADADSYTSRDLWFHHLELFNGGDGLLDIRGGSNITLSWSHLHTHKKAILAGDTVDGDPATGMDVTFHHNFFDRITLRGPQFLHGRAHTFNNYQFEWYEYGSGSLDGAQLFSEANVYQARPGVFCLDCPDLNPCGDHDIIVSKEALVANWSENGWGSTRSVGDLAVEGAVIVEHEPGNVFDPALEYVYQASPATPALAQQVRDGAGPRVDYCQE